MNSTSDYDQKIKPIRAQLIDGNKIEAQIQCQMKIDGLPDNAKKAYKFKNVQEPLVSTPVLCENGFEVKFTKKMYSYQKGPYYFNSIQGTRHQAAEIPQ